MSATVTITPGFLPPDGTPITCAVLRQIAQPSASANFSVPSATLNFLRNSNFNKTLWSNLSGLTLTSVTTEQQALSNAFYWTAIATPTGAGKALTVLPSTDVQSNASYYSMEVDLTSAGYTQFGVYSQIPSDVAAVLEGQQVTLSFWLKNIQSNSFTPTANFLSPNTQDVFSGAMTNIASASLQATPQGTWTKMSCTVTLSNALINNGLQVEIDFTTGSLTAISGPTVQFRFSEFFLQLGNVSTNYQSDPGLVSDVLNPTYGRILFGPTGSVVSTMNGSQDIWQPGGSNFGPYTGTQSDVSTGSDRWYLFQVMGTGGITPTQNALEIPNVANAYPHTRYSMRMTVSTALATLTAGQYCYVRQGIERQFARPLFDGTTSLSIVLQSSIVGVFCVTLRSQSTGNSYVMECPVGVVNTPQRFTFPAIPAMPSTASGGNWGTADTDMAYDVVVCLGSGTTFQAPAANTWETANYFATANQTNLFATLGNTLDITLLQHEAGPIVTPFLWVPFSKALMDCRRYYNQTYHYGTAPGTANANGHAVFTTVGTTSAFGTYRFPNNMRVSPSATFYNFSTGGTGTAWDLSSGSSIGSAPAWGSLTVDSSSNISFTSGGTAGHIMLAHGAFNSDY
jgi:hypothetical protein